MVCCHAALYQNELASKKGKRNCFNYFRLNENTKFTKKFDQSDNSPVNLKRELKILTGGTRCTICNIRL